MKRRIFDIAISVLLVVVLTLQIITMVKVFGGDEAVLPGDDTVSAGNSTADDVNKTMIHIDASYCSLRFPSKWMDYMKFTESTKDGVWSAHFGCEINKKTAELFTVHLNPAKIEDREGVIIKGGEEISVVLEMAEIDKSLWTKEELKLVNEMRDAKDEVIKSVLEYKELV